MQLPGWEKGRMAEEERRAMFRWRATVCSSQGMR
jgi:hypothetical protein